MKYILYAALILSTLSCKPKEEFIPREFSKIWTQDILKDSLLSIRAIELADNNVYYAANKGRYGVVLDDGSLVKDLVAYDSITPSFRAAAYTPKDFFIISIANPALIYKYGKKESVNTYIERSLVYEEHHEMVFYDAMDFWNDLEGIAMGDPTAGCMSILITRDGGYTWNKLSCDVLPEAMEGEAAFAASDTNIAIVGDHTWVATGGKASRILYSPDKGKTWSVYDTPIVQGKETTGMYSVDFYDKNNGFAIGGDYTKPEDNEANKIVTADGGKTWQVVAAGQEPGYRSCVQYIPGREGKELVTIGFKGIDYSNDGGYTWTHLSDESFFTIRFLNDSVAVAAGRGRISKITFRE